MSCLGEAGVGGQKTATSEAIPLKLAKWLSLSLRKFGTLRMAGDQAIAAERRGGGSGTSQQGGLGQAQRKAVARRRDCAICRTDFGPWWWQRVCKGDLSPEHLDKERVALLDGVEAEGAMELSRVLKEMTGLLVLEYDPVFGGRARAGRVRLAAEVDSVGVEMNGFKRATL